MKTIEEFKQSMGDMFASKKKNCQATIEELIKDQRKDEANLEKVKLNVYGIYETMIGAMEKVVLGRRVPDDEKAEAYYKEYLTCFDKIPASWREKLGKAKERDMIEEVVIEELKLDTVNEIKDYFLSLKEN